jgi:hypothetical protein
MLMVGSGLAEREKAASLMAPISFAGFHQDCQIFLATTYQNGKKYQITRNNTNWL